MLGTVWSICCVWNHFRSLSHSGMEVFILSLPYSKDRAGIKPPQAGSRACPLNLHNLLPSLVGARRCLRGWICVKYKENNLAGRQWGCKEGEREAFEGSRARMRSGLTPGWDAAICSVVMCVTEKEMATHSSTFAWKIPRTEECGRLQSIGSQRVGHDWATSLTHSLNLCNSP